MFTYESIVIYVRLFITACNYPFGQLLNVNEIQMWEVKIRTKSNSEL